MADSLWNNVRKICRRIEQDYDPENNLGKPAVTNIDMELRDAAWLLACFCEALDERVRELETNAAIRRQAEEEERLRE